MSSEGFYLFLPIGMTMSGHDKPLVFHESDKPDIIQDPIDYPYPMPDEIKEPDEEEDYSNFVIYGFLTMFIISSWLVIMGLGLSMNAGSFSNGFYYRMLTFIISLLVICCTLTTFYILFMKDRPDQVITVLWTIFLILLLGIVSLNVGTLIFIMLIIPIATGGFLMLYLSRKM